jgi:lysophospholipid acyltransferase (LPLAT)-like uncharacterized protein
LRILPLSAALLIKTWMLSCRLVKEDGLDLERKALARSPGGAVYAGWHQRMSYNFHYFGKRHITMMISQSRDGEYATRVALWLGFQNIRGSSTRGGPRALAQMIRYVRKGAYAGMLADGPQGPARIAKMGSVLIARNAEVPLIPVAWGANRCWMFHSWDRYLVPKPFARVVTRIEEPIWVPRSARDEELEQYRRLFEDRLNRAVRWCDEQFGQERPWRKVTRPGMPEIGPLADE